MYKIFHIVYSNRTRYFTSFTQSKSVKKRAFWAFVIRIYIRMRVQQLLLTRLFSIRPFIKCQYILFSYLPFTPTLCCRWRIFFFSIYFWMYCLPHVQSTKGFSFLEIYVLYILYKHNQFVWYSVLFQCRQLLQHFIFYMCLHLNFIPFRFFSFCRIYNFECFFFFFIFFLSFTDASGFFSFSLVLSIAIWIVCILIYIVNAWSHIIRHSTLQIFICSLCSHEDWMDCIFVYSSIFYFIIHFEAIVEMVEFFFYHRMFDLWHKAKWLMFITVPESRALHLKSKCWLYYSAI